MLGQLKTYIISLSIQKAEKIIQSVFDYYEYDLENFNFRISNKGLDRVYTFGNITLKFEINLNRNHLSPLRGKRPDLIFVDHHRIEQLEKDEFNFMIDGMYSRINVQEEKVSENKPLVVGVHIFWFTDEGELIVSENTIKKSLQRKNQFKIIEKEK